MKCNPTKKLLPVTNKQERVQLWEVEAGRRGRSSLLHTNWKKGQKKQTGGDEVTFYLFFWGCFVWAGSERGDDSGGKQMN